MHAWAQTGMAVLLCTDRDGGMSAGCVGLPGGTGRETDKGTGRGGIAFKQSQLRSLPFNARNTVARSRAAAAAMAARCSRGRQGGMGEGVGMQRGTSVSEGVFVE
jgi:hypothetical protein